MLDNCLFLFDRNGTEFINLVQIRNGCYGHKKAMQLFIINPFICLVEELCGFISRKMEAKCSSSFHLNAATEFALKISPSSRVQHRQTPHTEVVLILFIRLYLFSGVFLAIQILKTVGEKRPLCILY